MSSGESGKRKIDIKILTAIIPPAKELKGVTKGVIERRVRVRRKDEVKPECAILNPKLAEELKATDAIEIVVASKKKLRFKIVKDENVPEREVWCNSEVLKEHGIADNSIATARAAKTS